MCLRGDCGGVKVLKMLLGEEANGIADAECADALQATRDRCCILQAA